LNLFFHDRLKILPHFVTDDVIIRFNLNRNKIQCYFDFCRLFALEYIKIEQSRYPCVSVEQKTKSPSLPASPNFHISDVYRQILNNEPFICTEKLIRNKRMILFATDKKLGTLFSSEWIFLDDTFDSCPAQFKQTLYDSLLKIPSK